MRERGGLSPANLPEVRLLEGLDCLGLVGALQLGDEVGLLLHGRVVSERELLGNVTNLGARLAAVVEDILPVDDYAPLVPKESQGALYRSRLACTVRADEEGCVSLFDGEGNSI